MVSMRDLQTHIRAGYRLNKPKWTPDEMYSLMEKCWNFEPEQRPSFQEVLTTVTTCQKQLKTGQKFKKNGFGVAENSNEVNSLSSNSVPQSRTTTVSGDSKILVNMVPAYGGSTMSRNVTEEYGDQTTCCDQPLAMKPAYEFTDTTSTPIHGSLSATDNPTFLTGGDFSLAETEPVAVYDGSSMHNLDSELLGEQAQFLLRNAYDKTNWITQQNQSSGENVQTSRL